MTLSGRQLGRPTQLVELLREQVTVHDDRPESLFLWLRFGGKTIRGLLKADYPHLRGGDRVMLVLTQEGDEPITELVTPLTT